MLSPKNCAAGLQDDLERVSQAGGGRVDVTVGSALDIFSGPLPYSDVLTWHRRQQQQEAQQHSNAVPQAVPA